MNRNRNLRGPGGPRQPQGVPPSSYHWYYRRCPPWYYNHDWYDNDLYDYTYPGYDSYDEYDYTWDENYLSSATQQAFKAGMKMGMKKAKMMNTGTDSTLPVSPDEQEKGE